MYTIRKEFSFEAAHYLMGLPDVHPCSHLHGHSYRVIVEFKSEELTDTGFVKDYRELEVFKNWIVSKFDHTVLNDVLPEINPTAENLARYMFNTFSVCDGLEKLHAIEVCETTKTMARYEKTEG
jgi:6-pyruvoyltetrahydropterin/6-carboxytetrahydropterin synthase